MRQSWKHCGFTLIELVLVAAIIGLLASIAIPKFSNLIQKARESQLKATLGTLRAGLYLYYADNDGLRPDYMVIKNSGVLWPKYLDEWPVVTHPSIPAHVSSDRPSGWVNDALWSAGNFRAWVYEFGTSSLDFHINCTHTDMSGRVWSTW